MECYCCGHEYHEKCWSCKGTKKWPDSGAPCTSCDPNGYVKYYADDPPECKEHCACEREHSCLEPGCRGKCLLHCACSSENRELQRKAWDWADPLLSGLEGRLICSSSLRGASNENFQREIRHCARTVLVQNLYEKWKDERWQRTPWD